MIGSICVVDAHVWILGDGAEDIKKEECPMAELRRYGSLSGQK